MKTILILFVLLVHGNNLLSQTLPLAIYSLKTAKTQQTDSLVRHKKEDVAGNMDSANSHSKSAIQNMISSKTDSSTKASYRNKLNAKANAFSSDLKSLPKRSYQAIKK